MVCPPVWSIIHSLKIVDYLSIKVDKPISHQSKWNMMIFISVRASGAIIKKHILVVCIKFCQIDIIKMYELPPFNQFKINRLSRN